MREDYSKQQAFKQKFPAAEEQSCRVVHGPTVELQQMTMSVKT